MHTWFERRAARTIDGGDDITYGCSSCSCRKAFSSHGLTHVVRRLDWHSNHSH